MFNKLMFGTKALDSKKSKLNGIVEVVKTLGVGTYIRCGGITQSGGVVENLWKSALKGLKGTKTNSALILGLGGGSVVGEIIKIFPRAKITGVEIDPQMVDLGEKYLGLDKKRVDVVITDAYIFKSKKSFDLIIVDIYKGQKYPKKFESEYFLKKVNCLLTKEGVAVFNRLRNDEFDFKERLEGVFLSVEVLKPLINKIFVCRHK